MAGPFAEAELAVMPNSNMKAVPPNPYDEALAALAECAARLDHDLDNLRGTVAKVTVDNTPLAKNNPQDRPEMSVLASQLHDLADLYRERCESLEAIIRSIDL